MTNRLTKIIGLAILFIGFGVLAGCSNTKDPKPVPKKYQSYKSLVDNELTSGGLSLVKIIDYDKTGYVRGLNSVFYDPESQQFSILIEVDDRSRMDSPIELLRFDEQGRLTHTHRSSEDQRISSLYYSHNLTELIDGSVFYGTHYVDVFRKDEVNAVEYHRTIDIETLTIDQFKQFYDQADLVYYGRVTSNFETEELDYLFNSYMQIDGQWFKFTAPIDPDGYHKQSSGSLERQSPATGLFSAVSKNTRARGIHDVLIPPKSLPMKLRKGLVNLMCDNESNPHCISRKYKAKERYVKCSLAGAFSPTGGNCKQGWTGASYYELALGDGVFQFKTYGDVIALQPTLEDKLELEKTGKHLAILQIRSSAGDSGLYLVTKN